MQMIPFLVYPKWGAKKTYLNSLRPLSGIRYNQSGEWVGKHDEGPAEIKQKPHHDCSKNKINPFIQLGAVEYSPKKKQKKNKNELDESFHTNLHSSSIWIS